MKPELTAMPRLAPGVRLNEKTEQQRMLLMPERALRLIGPSLEIVQLCDGKHTVQQIAEKLHALYSRPSHSASPMIYSATWRCSTTSAPSISDLERGSAASAFEQLHPGNQSIPSSPS